MGGATRCASAATAIGRSSFPVRVRATNTNMRSSRHPATCCWKQTPSHSAVKGGRPLLPSWSMPRRFPFPGPGATMETHSMHRCRFMKFISAHGAGAMRVNGSPIASSPNSCLPTQPIWVSLTSSSCRSWSILSTGRGAINRPGFLRRPAVSVRLRISPR